MGGGEYVAVVGASAKTLSPDKEILTYPHINVGANHFLLYKELNLRLKKKTLFSQIIYTPPREYIVNLKKDAQKNEHPFSFPIKSKNGNKEKNNFNS